MDAETSPRKRGAQKQLTLPAFLKILTSEKLPMPKAMALASKLYKTHSHPENLAKLTDGKLKELGVEGKEERKLLLAGIRKAGYNVESSSRKRGAGVAFTDTSGASGEQGSSTLKNGSRKKRKRDDDLNELLPEGPRDEGMIFGSFEFNENLDEDVLLTKYAVVNRAPVMLAWATVVAGRLGFGREEALSIAHAYMEMNATSKGISIGKFDKKEGKGVELRKGESQPYVDLMGRRPLYSSQPTNQWRALFKGQPVLPSNAFSYLSSAFRQTLPFIMGALRLLAESYTKPDQLNRDGFNLYMDFRPKVDEWGGKGEIRCDKVLSLKKATRVETSNLAENRSHNSNEGYEVDGQTVDIKNAGSDEGAEVKKQPSTRNIKSMTIEEYEAALDDEAYDDLLVTEDF